MNFGLLAVCIVVLVPLLDFFLHRMSIRQGVQMKVLFKNGTYWYLHSWARGSLFLMVSLFSVLAVSYFMDQVSHIAPSELSILFDLEEENGRSFDPSDRAALTGEIARSILPYPTALGLLYQSDGKYEVSFFIPPTVDSMYLELVSGEKLSIPKTPSPIEGSSDMLYIILRQTEGAISLPKELLQKYILCHIDVTMESLPVVTASSYPFLVGASLDRALELTSGIIREGAKKVYQGEKHEDIRSDIHDLALFWSVVATLFFVLWMKDRRILLGRKLFVLALFLQLQPLFGEDSFDQYIDMVNRQISQAQWLLKTDGGVERAQKTVEKCLDFIPEGEARQRALISLAKIECMEGLFKSAMHHVSLAFIAYNNMSEESYLYTLSVIEALNTGAYTFSIEERGQFVDLLEKLLLMAPQSQKGNAAIIQEMIASQELFIGWQGNLSWPYVWLSEECDAYILQSSTSSSNMEEAFLPSLIGPFFLNQLKMIAPVIEQKAQKLGFHTLSLRIKSIQNGVEENLSLDEKMKKYYPYQMGLCCQIIESMVSLSTDTEMVESGLSFLIEELFRLKRLSEIFPKYKDIYLMKSMIVQEMLALFFEDGKNILSVKTTISGLSVKCRAYDQLQRYIIDESSQGSVDIIFQDRFLIKIYFDSLLVPILEEDGSSTKVTEMKQIAYLPFQKILGDILNIQESFSRFGTTLNQQKKKELQEFAQTIETLFPYIFYHKNLIKDEAQTPYIQLLIKSWFLWLRHAPSYAFSWIDAFSHFDSNMGDLFIRSVRSEFFSELIQKKVITAQSIGEITALSDEDSLLMLSLMEYLFVMDELKNSQENFLNNAVQMLRTDYALSLNQFFDLKRGENYSPDALKLSSKVELALFAQFEKYLISALQKVGYYPNHISDLKPVLARLKEIVENINTALVKDEIPSLALIQEKGSLLEIIEGVFFPENQSHEENPSNVTKKIEYSSPQVTISDFEITPEKAVSLYRIIDARDKMIVR